MAIIFENDTELRSVKTNSSIIPEYSLSIMEDALYVAEAIEMADKACSECIGINELNIYESTGELVSYNEADEEAASGKWNLKNIKDTLMKWAKKLWEAIKTFFEKAVGKIAELAKGVDSKIKAANKAHLDKLPADAKFGEVYSFDGLDKFNSNEFCNNAATYAKELKDTAKSIEDLKFSAADVLKKITGEDYDNLTAFKKNLMDKLCGEKVTADKAWVLDKFEVLKDAAQMKKAKQDIKSLYAKTRKIVDGYMSEIKGLDGSKAEVFVATKSARTQIISCLNTCNSTILNAYVRQHAQAKAVLAKAFIGLTKKAEEAKTESVEFADQQSLVESLFDF